VDSGWDRSLDEPRVLPGVGFVDPEDDFALGRNDDDADVLGHGTACADLILRIAPDARVIPVKVFGKVLETSPITLHAALTWAIQAGVQVINVSLGTQLTNMLHPLYRACEEARRAGIIIVAAGHNANAWSYPAIFENVIGVWAARFDSPYHFRYRPEHTMEVEAWGVEQPVLWVGGQRLIKHGTSFAAPNVAGIVALILERHPGATLEEVREMLARFALSVDLTAGEGEELPPEAWGLPPGATPGEARQEPSGKTPQEKAPRTRRASAAKPVAAPAAVESPADTPSKPRRKGPQAASPADAPAKPARKSTPRSRGAATRESVAATPAAATTDAAGKKPRKGAARTRPAGGTEAAATSADGTEPSKAPRKSTARVRPAAASKAVATTPPAESAGAKPRKAVPKSTGNRSRGKKASGKGE
jgi:subtilisin family serine protease